jgi:16S rRNA (guanine966-N2)-methyltransferase
VIAIDKSIRCIHYLKDMAKQHKLEQIKTYNADVFKYLEMETDTYDLIFADPPYDLSRIPKL